MRRWRRKHDHWTRREGVGRREDDFLASGLAASAIEEGRATGSRSYEVRLPFQLVLCLSSSRFLLGDQLSVTFQRVAVGEQLPSWRESEFDRDRLYLLTCTASKSCGASKFTIAYDHAIAASCWGVNSDRFLFPLKT